MIRRRVNIEHTFDILPHEHVEAKVDEYALFVKEYNESEKYRLVFSFNPICSNVLFNTITEITQNEGSDECKLFNMNVNNALIQIDSTKDKALYDYLTYTSRKDSNDKTTFLTKENMIMDTGYSHPNIGNFEYHCGYDIFDNHILRSKDFVVVNEINNSITEPSQRQCFNTLSDYLRDNIGTIKMDRKLSDRTDTNTLKRHLYTTDTIMSYTISINENLTESNGWMGFVNKGNLQIPNYNGKVINKVINNREIGSFIDMYPDRSLYSPLPKYNKYRERYEKNWEFCLTYPYENDYNNILVTENDYNGIECMFKLDGTLQIGVTPNTKIITLRTFVEHGLVPGDTFKLAYFYNPDGTLRSGETVNNCTVVDTGSGMYEKKQYIKIRINDIQNLVTRLYEQYQTFKGETLDANGVFALKRDFFVENNIKFRFCRVVGSSKCKYYIRKFKILTKQDGSQYNYTLNKLAFSKNIYNDRIGEVIYDDIIDVSAIKNNLGLPLSEIFISVFKTNHGYDKWYANNTSDINITDPDIEFSHCFGELTSGFDMPSDDVCVDYNIHRLHNINISNGVNIGIPDSGKPLEKNLCLKNNIDVFCGDLVEFNEKSLVEKVLEEVQYRFNTAQRECTNGLFSTLRYHDIKYDDYDVVSGEFIETKNLAIDNSGNVNNNIPINLNPEGYFYKAHYRIPLKEYMPRVYWGSDILVNCVRSVYKSSGRTYKYITYDKNMYEYEITCDKSYNMTIYDKIYLVNKRDVNDVVYGVVNEFNDNIYKVIVDKRITFSNYKFFKVNPVKPNDAYTLTDGSGNYIWRVLKGFNDINEDSSLHNRPFTNGTHYLHEEINLYLKRQDPSGLYGFSFNSKTPLFKSNLIILGNEKEVNNNDYVENIEQIQC